MWQVTTLEAYPQLIGYDTEVFEYFRTQCVQRLISNCDIFNFNVLITRSRSHLCGYDLNLTYPQTGGHFPSLPDIFDSDAGILSSASLDRSNVLGRSKGEGLASMLGSPILKKRNHGLSTREIGKRDAAKEAWKRDLTGRTNGTIDPYYGCFLLEESERACCMFPTIQLKTRRQWPTTRQISPFRGVSATEAVEMHESKLTAPNLNLTALGGLEDNAFDVSVVAV